ncbi:hypothetical protein FCULG_00000055 [Fusarium culmorum]|uniref:Uncharacterized protein n=1 Tax=Fusarium culmorum TaxID=5516 RepID=A0A2T4GL58_FUSCU|nr:hypothetical protein FCULG_00000055 [Fusarium culmorum]
MRYVCYIFVLHRAWQCEDPNKTKILGLVLRVGFTKNLATVLRNSIARNIYHAPYEYHRHKFETGVYTATAWLRIDAICINRNDQAEELIQVQPSRYDRPVDNKEETQVCQLAERLKNFVLLSEQECIEDNRIATFMELGKSDYNATAQVEICWSPTMVRRILILQEAVLTQIQPISLCGPCELGYDIFLKTLIPMPDQSEDKQLLYPFMVENPVSFKAIEGEMEVMSVNMHLKNQPHNMQYVTKGLM